MNEKIKKIWHIYKFIFTVSFIAFNIIIACIITFLYFFFGIDKNLFTLDRIFSTEILILLTAITYGFLYLLRVEFDE